MLGALAGLAVAVVWASLPSLAWSQSQRRPSFGAEVRRVRVDVVVVDGDGAFVEGLSPGAFRLFEDGVEQEILSVQVVDVGAGRVSATSLGEVEPPRPGDIDPPGDEAGPPSSDSADLGAVIYLVDGLGLAARNQVRFAIRWAHELEARPGLLVPHAVYRINRIGQIEEITALTTDLDELRAGVEEIAARADTDLFRNLRILDRNYRRFDLLRQFTEALAGRTGRTALVYVSAGIGMMSRGSPDLRILEVQEQTHEAANAANVTFYGLDPSLMYELVGTGIDMSRQSGTSARTRAGSGRDEVGNSLRHAATATGGKAFVGWSELGRVIDIIERDTDRYYLLTYSPARAVSDGAHHELHVEVDRPGVEVRSRRGYVDDTLDELAAKRVSGALRLPGAAGSVPMVVEAFRGRSVDGQPQYRVRVSADTAAFERSITDDGTLSVFVEAHVGAVDANGDTVVYRRTALSYPMQGGSEQPECVAGSAATSVISHAEVLNLRPGEYELKVALVDGNSDRLGATGLPLLVPLADEPWPTSSLILESIAGGERRPLIGGRACVGDQIFGVVEIYDVDTPEVTARIVAQDGSETDAAAAVELSRASGDVTRASMRLPVLAAGEYRVEMRVVAGDLVETLNAVLRIEPRAGR